MKRFLLPMIVMVAVSCKKEDAVQADAAVEVSVDADVADLGQEVTVAVDAAVSVTPAEVTQTGN